jgi:hypothetical protein
MEARRSERLLSRAHRAMNSPLQDRFRWRYSLLRPKLQHAVDR